MQIVIGAGVVAIIVILVMLAGYYAEGPGLSLEERRQARAVYECEHYGLGDVCDDLAAGEVIQQLAPGPQENG